MVERRASNPARRVRFSLPAPVCRRSSSRKSRALVTRRSPVRSRPAAPRTPRSSNGRTPVSKTGNGGSNPSRGAIFSMSGLLAYRRSTGLLTRGGRFDSCAVHQISERCRSGQTAHIGNVMGRRRLPGFESLPLRQMCARGPAEGHRPSKPTHAGSNPAGRAIPSESVQLLAP